MNLTHLDDNNRPKMVDVSDKKETTRVAIASGQISMSAEAFEAIVENTTKKGPVIQTAVIAAIIPAAPAPIIAIFTFFLSRIWQAK